MQVLRTVTLVSLTALAAPAALDAGGLPSCRVRLTTAGFAPSVSSQVLRDVAASVTQPNQSCALVASIAEADVLLELDDYTFKILPDDTPAHHWLFTVRRLGEPDITRAIYRFVLMAPAPAAPQEGLRPLPRILADLCAGIEPNQGRRF